MQILQECRNQFRDAARPMTRVSDDSIGILPPETEEPQQNNNDSTGQDKEVADPGIDRLVVRKCEESGADFLPEKTCDGLQAAGWADNC